MGNPDPLVDRIGLDGYSWGDCNDPDKVRECREEWVDDTTDVTGETTGGVVLFLGRPSDEVPFKIRWLGEGPGVLTDRLGGSNGLCSIK